MLSKLFYLIALVIFIILAIATVTNPTKWMYLGFASIAAGLLLEGFGPAFGTVFTRRRVVTE